MKRKGGIFMAIAGGAMLLPIAGCANQEEDAFPYDSLYENEFSFREEKDEMKTRGSFGFNSEQKNGYNGWTFLSLSKDGSSRLLMEGDGTSFSKGGAHISVQEVQSSVDDHATYAYAFSKESSNALAYTNLKIKEGKGKLKIFKNGELLKEASYKEGDSLYVETSFAAKQGDVVTFVLASTSETTRGYFDPSICMDQEDFSLYHLTPFGKQYGDVFPYYDEETGMFYMFYLWTDDARQNDYKYALDLSSDFFNYTNVPESDFKVWDYYKHHGNLSLVYDVGRFIDLTKYKLLRDNALIFDEENHRFLLIGGCYYAFDSTGQISDLVVYESEDDLGLVWKKDGNPVALNYNRNLPECPSILKIKNRWYAFVSVAYNTAHQVGPLQYWIGDEGKDIMGVDFLSKDFQFLDGEDLCAARVFNVKDRVYFYGWIPATYDTMPWAPWGGYLNLPREVVVHEDGTLGGRMDPGLKKKINYGNIVRAESLDVQGSLSLGDSFDRNFVSMHVDMGNAKEFSYVMKQGDRTYRISILKEGTKAKMQISSPEDPKHKINSYLDIPKKDSYDIYCSIDGEFIEFFVDDAYSLTGHTAMKNASYEASLSSDSSVSIKDLSIDKLVPYWNLLV